ncbi:MAG: sigma-70 family RNA polymerase sigma factor [Sciscionella sp.]
MPPDLVAAAVTGDRRAVADLLAILRPIILRYCRARIYGGMRTMSDAEDLTQEVLIGVISALPRYCYDMADFLPFVYSIATHKVIDAFRRGSRQVPTASIDVDGHAIDWMDTAPGPEMQAESRESNQMLRRLLSTLPSHAREVLILRLILGFSPEATAGCLGLPSAGAVRVAQHRALRRLRAELAANAHQAAREVTAGSAAR